MNLPPPVHHVFVDYENMHEIDSSIIGRAGVTVTLLLGANQTKLDVQLVEKLLVHAASVHLIRLGSHGRNALDFTLVYYVGRAVAADPTGYFHIISRDTGFDPLIEHLKGKRIHADRHESYSGLPFIQAVKTATPAPFSSPSPAPPKPAAPKSKSLPALLDENARKVLEHLRDHPKGRPAREKTLVKHVLTLFGVKINEADALILISHLRQAGHLSTNEKGGLTYHL